jgi:lysine-ketoglutarate reductase/saccharopine dehydrogenase-like protein (TIGR00300 family)
VHYNPRMPSETVRLDGHIIDSQTLSRVLDLILLYGGDYDITEFRIGTKRAEPSHAEIVVSAPTSEGLQQILQEIGQLGAEAPADEARWVPAPADGVFPDDFYSTTNLESFVRVDGGWRPIERIEMDCGVVLQQREDGPHAACVPLHRVRQGDQVLVGELAVKVVPPPRKDPAHVFGFMSSEVSAERPKELTVAAVARGMLETRRRGLKILFVGGPAVVHTGAGGYLEQLIADGWIDVLFAGNALATHDIESALFGTSLGVQLATGVPMASGHNHHLRAINTIRHAGGIRQAVEQGVLTRGIMHACITHGVDYVLAGSIRDDGPLPDVITDVVRAQDAMRERVQGVGLAIMAATTLHSVATGNLLPASVQIICVDNNIETITKLMDRGTHQAFGLVTDCQFFLKELAGRTSSNSEFGVRDAELGSSSEFGMRK